MRIFHNAPPKPPTLRRQITNDNNPIKFENASNSLKVCELLEKSFLNPEINMILSQLHDDVSARLKYVPGSMKNLLDFIRHLPRNKRTIFNGVPPQSCRTASHEEDHNDDNDPSNGAMPIIA